MREVLLACEANKQNFGKVSDVSHSEVNHFVLLRLYLIEFVLHHRDILLQQIHVEIALNSLFVHSKWFSRCCITHRITVSFLDFSHRLVF
jgi:hypothetical protein